MLGSTLYKRADEPLTSMDVTSALRHSVSCICTRFAWILETYKMRCDGDAMFMVCRGQERQMVFDSVCGMARVTGFKLLDLTRKLKYGWFPTRRQISESIFKSSHISHRKLTLSILILYSFTGYRLRFLYG